MMIFSFDKNFVEIIQKESDLCITRAGASTLAELSVLNVPFVAVPSTKHLKIIINMKTQIFIKR